MKTNTKIRSAKRYMPSREDLEMTQKVFSGLSLLFLLGILSGIAMVFSCVCWMESGHTTVAQTFGCEVLGIFATGVSVLFYRHAKKECKLAAKELAKLNAKRQRKPARPAHTNQCPTQANIVPLPPKGCVRVTQQIIP